MYKYFFIDQLTTPFVQDGPPSCDSRGTDANGGGLHVNYSAGNFFQLKLAPIQHDAKYALDLKSIINYTEII
jgi:hypothetical protein